MSGNPACSRSRRKKAAADAPPLPLSTRSPADLVTLEDKLFVQGLHDYGFEHLTRLALLFYARNPRGLATAVGSLKGNRDGWMGAGE